MAVYLKGIYMDEQVKHDFEGKYLATGKRYYVGKSCVRFRKIEDLPLPLIGEAIRTHNINDFIDRVKQLRTHTKKS